MRTFSFASFRLAQLCVALTLLTTALAARAEYVWLDRDADGKVLAHVGELNAARLPAVTVTAARAYLADGKDLPLTADGESMKVDTAASAANADLRLVASRVTDKGVLNYYQARLGRSETRAINDLELVPTEPNGNTFKLSWKGNTVAAAQVNVETADGWFRTLKPNKDGTVTLPTPFPALYLLEVTARINGAVTADGKKYEDVRHTATLAFEVKR